MAADTLPVEHLFTMELETDLAANAVIKGGPQGTRIVAAVTGGHFEGPKLKGTAHGPSGDWVTARKNKTVQLDVRLLLVTEDGASILMQYKGIGKPLDGGRTEIRTAPQFETGDERYAWLNDVQAVGVGTAEPGKVTYDIYALR